MNILTFVAPGTDADLAAYLSRRMAKETAATVIENETTMVTEAESLGVETWSDLAKVTLAAPAPYDAIVVAGTGRSMSLRDTAQALTEITQGLPLTTCAAFVQGGRDDEYLRLVNSGFSHIISTTSHYLTLAAALREDHMRQDRIAQMFRDNARDIVQPPLPPAPQARDFGTQETAKRQGAEDRDDAFKLIRAGEAARYRDTPQQPLKPRAANPAYVSYKGARLNILEAYLNDALCLLVEAKGGHVDLLDRLTSQKGWPLKGATITTYVAALKASICRQTSLPRKEVNELIYNPPGTSPTTYALHNEDGAFAVHEICAPTATTAPTPQP